MKKVSDTESADLRSVVRFSEYLHSINHPLLLTMPYPQGVSRALKELEQLTSLVVDQSAMMSAREEAAEDLRYWLSERPATLCKDGFVKDLLTVLLPHPWSCSLATAFLRMVLDSMDYKFSSEEYPSGEWRNIGFLVKDGAALAPNTMLPAEIDSLKLQALMLLESLSNEEMSLLNTTQRLRAIELIFLHAVFPCVPDSTDGDRTGLNFIEGRGRHLFNMLSKDIDYTSTSIRQRTAMNSYGPAALHNISRFISDWHEGLSNGSKTNVRSRLPEAEHLNSGLVRVVIPCEIPRARDRDDAETIKRFEALRQPMPVKLLPSLDELTAIESKLINEFPWARAAIRTILMELKTRRGYGAVAMHIKPILLVGSPGVGKTRLARRLAEELVLPFRVISIAGMEDARVLTGTSRGWSSGQPSPLLEFLLTNHSASALVLLDEVDKSTSRTSNAPQVTSALLALLEQESAARWFDSFLQTPCDLSSLIFICTANDLQGLTNALLSRLTVLRIESPTLADIQKVIPFALHEVANEWSLPVDALPCVDPAALAKAPRDLRALQAWLKSYLAAWLMLNPRQIH